MKLYSIKTLLHTFTCILLVNVTLNMLTSCEKDVKHALDLSGSNRAELEKVLAHFRDDVDGLKYRAAKYLIVNAPYHYTYSGDVMRDYENVYLSMTHKALHKREAYFCEATKDFAMLQPKIKVDVRTLSAKYLIKAINEACDVWASVTWNKDYDESIFFDYVLPYRILDEELSNWREVIESNYASLFEDAVLSKRGILYESENAILKACEVYTTEGASCGSAAMLTSKNVSIDYVMHEQYAEAKKRLFIRYTSIADNPRIVVKLNGHTIDTISLNPTDALTTFTTSRSDICLDLKRGKNTVSISSVSDSIGIYYIQVNSVEPVDLFSQSDFSSDYCMISNKQSNRIATSTNWSSLTKTAQRLKVPS